jgi:hypothetical protein
MEDIVSIDLRKTKVIFFVLFYVKYMEPFGLNNVVCISRNFLYCGRFPIPDMRNESESDNRFWYYRDVYGDILFAELSEVTVQSVMTSHQLAQSYEFQAKSVLISFQVRRLLLPSDIIQPVHVI